MMDERKTLVLFDEQELELLRQNFRANSLQENGELGGHMMYEETSEDLDYLLSSEEMDELFKKEVLGVASDVE